MIHVCIWKMIPTLQNTLVWASSFYYHVFHSTWGAYSTYCDTKVNKNDTKEGYIYQLLILHWFCRFFLQISYRRWFSHWVENVTMKQRCSNQSAVWNNIFLITCFWKFRESWSLSSNSTTLHVEGHRMGDSYVHHFLRNNWNMAGRCRWHRH